MAMGMAVGMTLREMKGGFFDRPRVLAAADAVTHDFLNSAGSWCMTTARRSMRYIKDRTVFAEPGQPPRAHRQNPLLRDKLLYAFDAARKGVVIGPALLRGRTNPVNVPLLMEIGSSRVRVRNPMRKAYRVGMKGPIRARRIMADSPLGQQIATDRLQVAAWARLRTPEMADRANVVSAQVYGPAWRVCNYPPHPYMRPAFEKTLPKLPQFWREAFKSRWRASA